MALIKTSVRTKRVPCEKCGAHGPYYEVHDTETLATRLVLKTAETRSAATGSPVDHSALHVCVDRDYNGNHNGDTSVSVASDDDTMPTAEEVADMHNWSNQYGGGGDMAASDSAAADDADSRAREALWEILGKPKVDIDEATVERIATDVATRVVGDMAMPEKTIVVTPAERREVTGVTHKQFGDVLAMVAAGENVQLVGGPGVGKTHMVEQIAEALGLPFYAIGFHLQSTASELRGYMDATGNYVPTVVADWASNPEGGLLLCDELDRSHPGIQAALNSLLSNRFIALPNREIIRLTERHVIIGATNTWGDGPTSEFPAAMPFSAEFKDRFAAILIETDEDIELAAAMAKGAPKDLTERAVAYVRSVRSKVKSSAISGVVVSPRASQRMAALLAQGMSWDAAVNVTLRKGMSDDMWKKVSA